MSGSHENESARLNPSGRDIDAFVDATRFSDATRSSMGFRRAPRVLRLRFNIPEATRAALIVALAWLGAAQWLGYVLRLLRENTGAM